MKCFLFSTAFLVFLISTLRNIATTKDTTVSILDQFKFEYLTLYNVYISILFSILSIILEPLSYFKIQLRCLKTIREIIFTSCLALSILISIVYWPFRIYDKNFFIPESYNGVPIKISLCIDFMLHLVPTMFHLIFWIFHPTEYHRSARSLLYLIIAVFTFSQIYNRYIFGIWPYVFMNRLNIKWCILLLILILILVEIILKVIVFVDRKRKGRNIRRILASRIQNSKKISKPKMGPKPR